MEIQAYIVIREALILLNLDFQVAYIIKVIGSLNVLYNLTIN